MNRTTAYKLCYASGLGFSAQVLLLLSLFLLRTESPMPFTVLLVVGIVVGAVSFLIGVIAGGIALYSGQFEIAFKGAAWALGNGVMLLFPIGGIWLANLPKNMK